MREDNLNVPTEIIAFQIAGTSFHMFLDKGKLKLELEIQRVMEVGKRVLGFVLLSGRNSQFHI